MYRFVLLLILQTNLALFSQWTDNAAYQQKATELGLISLTSFHAHGERILVSAGTAIGSFSILYSDDDGTTWTEGTYGDNTISMTTFASVSADTIYAFGYSIFGTKGMHISTDAGVSWALNSGDYSNFPLIFIPSQMAANSERVIVSGLDNNGGVMLSEDQGQTWTSIDTYGEEGNRVNINQITEVNGDFYSAGEGFFKANFDSTRWDLVNDFEFLDAFYYEGKFYGSHGVLFESSDLGANWETYELFGTRLAEKITMIGNNLFVSIAESGNPHVVMYTDFADEVDITEGLVDYDQSTRILKWVNNSTSIFAIRPNSPALWHYKVGGATSVEDEYQINEFRLSQNYPNPFNPTTKIKYTIADRFEVPNNNVVLKIYDVLGNEITTLVNQPQTVGTYEVEFDASGFTSGVYFYKLTSGNFSETRKMILTK